jgi:hypothetical protein
MELNIMENSTVSDSKGKTTGILVENGTTYTMRVLTISMDFPGGIFMNMAQKPEYSGEYAVFVSDNTVDSSIGKVRLE